MMTIKEQSLQLFRTVNIFTHTFVFILSQCNAVCYELQKVFFQNF